MDWQSGWQTKQSDTQPEGGCMPALSKGSKGSEGKVDWHDAASPPAKSSWGKGMGQSDAVLAEPQARKASWEEDALEDADLSSMITSSKLKGIELEIVALSKRLAGSDDMRKAGTKLTNLLRSITMKVNRKWKRPLMVEMIGSYAQDTEIDGSELDIA